MEKFEVKGVIWYGSIGIVQVETSTGIRYFIGKGDGINEERDRQYIAEWGSHFPLDVGDLLFGRTPFVMYEDKVVYGDRKSIDFVGELINYRDMNSYRRPAEIE